MARGLGAPPRQAERHNSRRTLPRVTQDSHTERISLRPRVSPRGKYRGEPSFYSFLDEWCEIAVATRLWAS